MANTFAEALSPNHYHRCAIARVPEQRNPPKSGFYASVANLH